MTSALRLLLACSLTLGGRAAPCRSGIGRHMDFQPQYTFRNHDTRYVAQLLFQPTMPYAGFLVPGLDVCGFRSVARAQIFAQSQQIGSNAASGLTDLRFTDGVVHRVGPFELGAGFTTFFLPDRDEPGARTRQMATGSDRARVPRAHASGFDLVVRPLCVVGGR